jgi:hypothetical protein
MPSFRVVWEVDVDANTPLEAAREAFSMMTDPESTAVVFSVTGPDDARDTVTIDLLNLDAPEEQPPQNDGYDYDSGTLAKER